MSAPTAEQQSNLHLGYGTLRFETQIFYEHVVGSRVVFCSPSLNPNKLILCHVSVLQFAFSCGILSSGESVEASREAECLQSRMHSIRTTSLKTSLLTACAGTST